MPVDVAIVGAGPGGCAAAIQCRRSGLSVALYDATGRAGGLIAQAWSIENEAATGGPISGLEYVRRLRLALNRFGLRVTPGEVTAVAPGYRLLGPGLDRAARNVILATGTRPRVAGIPGESALVGRGLSYDVLPAIARRPASALVIGGGEAAFDYALSLAFAGVRVTIAVRGDRPRANDRLAAAVANASTIELSFHTTVSELSADGDGLRARATNLRESRFDAVVVAVGRTPVRPTLPEDLCPTDARAELTIAPGLYIAGDARLGTLGQSGIAVGDGLQIAQAIAERLR